MNKRQKAIFNHHFKTFLKQDIDINAFGMVFEDVALDMLKTKWETKKYSVRNQKDCIEYFRSLLGDKIREEIWIILLDAKNRVITSEKVFEGTTYQSILYPKEIITKALNTATVSIVLIHNHPSGNINPSEADKKITKKILFACKAMDLNFLDHMIVGVEGYFSFYEQGFIEKCNSEYKTLMEGGI